MMNKEMEQERRGNILVLAKDVRKAIDCADALLKHDGAATDACIKLLLETCRALCMEVLIYIDNKKDKV